MDKDNKLSPQEITYLMSPTPWRKSERGLVIIKGDSWKIKFERAAAGGGDFEEHSIKNLNADISAINNAVNNTYGKSLNPEAYEEVVKILEQLSEGYITSETRIKEALLKAKIWKTKSK